jgi:hypothetical protein
MAALLTGLCCRMAAADPPPAHWDARIVEYGPDGDVTNSLQLVPDITIKNSLDKDAFKLTPQLGIKYTFQLSADPSMRVTCSRIGRTGNKDLYRVVISSRTAAREEVKTIELGDNRVLLWRRGSSRLILEPTKSKEELERDRQLAARGKLPPAAFPNAALVNYGRNGRWKSISSLGSSEPEKTVSKSPPIRLSFSFSSIAVTTTITRDGQPPLKVRCERWGRKGNKDVYRFEIRSESDSAIETKLVELGDKPVVVLDEPDNRLMLQPMPRDTTR